MESEVIQILQEVNMASPLSPESLSRLPIFPLPQTVFFPHTVLPLHIFEQRYRKMTSDVLSSEGPMAIVQLKDNAPEVMGLPAIHHVAGVGKVLEHRKLPDGRYYLLLQGLARVRIKEELDTPEPYRIVRAELLNDEYPEDLNTLLADKTTLHGFVLSLSRTQPRVAGALAEILRATDDPAVIADVVASLLLTESEERQKFLETVRVGERLEAVTATIAQLVAVDNDGDDRQILN